MYILIPKDFLNDIETKTFFNLTKRQLICFSLGAVTGLPTYFLLKNLNPTIAIIGMMVVAIPFFMAAIFKKNQHRLETVVKQIYDVKFGGKPKYRKYQTNNYFQQLENQYNLNQAIIQMMGRRYKRGTSHASQRKKPTKTRKKGT